jgi:hypothetical protein
MHSVFRGKKREPGRNDEWYLCRSNKGVGTTEENEPSLETACTGMRGTSPENERGKKRTP